MKKIGLLLLVVFASVALFGCTQGEFKVDGEFMAFETSVHSNGAMQVTMVSVIIENGEIVGYNIDARQGTKTQTAGADTTEDTSDDVYSFAWNTKTKKQLGDAYNMVTYGNAIAEWYVQAGRIEAAMLANGVDSVTTNAETHVIDNVAGVTIKDGGYLALAAEAVELAKAGKFQAVVCSGTDLYIASMVVAKGEISELELNVLQKKSVLANKAVFEWNEKTKQELGADYGMKGTGAAYTFANGVWTASATEKSANEWFEQANLITNYVMENGNVYNLRAIGGRGISVDGSTIVDGLAGVTIKTETYIVVLTDLFANVANGQLK
ncbi:MAG: hypothetical protein CVV56_04015 [Tenericutes bacterium HGW-Tenericutes-1]|jgi:hypothetical protein|nr:MAG: hypothetical protein CVV56_04015 [Tenericutes bacterium HGW-Tenericutes-1]